MMPAPSISERCDNHKLLSDRIASAQVRLRAKLLALDVKTCGISDYNQRYLGAKIDRLEATLQLYGHLLCLSLGRQPIPLERFVLVDYGGGSGVLSLLALELGIGAVIYNDIYDVSCKDVRLLSNMLGLPLAHIICGDIDQLVLYVRSNSISVHAVTSHDVLEHIYNVKSHFKSLSAISNSCLRIVYASGANIKNPLCVHIVRKKQMEVECKDRGKQWGHKERDSLRAYLDIRKEIISAYAPGLNSEMIEQLGCSTRGLIKADIEKCVDEYRLKGGISFIPDHPTNTCDPYTGNWCEHLMETRWLQGILEDEGFLVEILPGQYRMSGSTPIKKGIEFFLNAVIRLLGKWGMFIAPYYVVYADRLAEKEKSLKEADA